MKTLKCLGFTVSRYGFFVVVEEPDEFFAVGCEGKNHFKNWCDLAFVEGRRHIVGYWYVLERFNENLFLYNFDFGVWDSVGEADVFSNGVHREELPVLRKQFPYDSCVNILSFRVPHHLLRS